MVWPNNAILMKEQRASLFSHCEYTFGRWYSSHRGMVKCSSCWLHYAAISKKVTSSKMFRCQSRFFISLWRFHFGRRILLGPSFTTMSFYQVKELSSIPFFVSLWKLKLNFAEIDIWHGVIELKIEFEKSKYVIDLIKFEPTAQTLECWKKDWSWSRVFHARSRTPLMRL